MVALKYGVSLHINNFCVQSVTGKSPLFTIASYRNEDSIITTAEFIDS
jgi:hypothetical protein